MRILTSSDHLATALVTTIRSGNVEALRRHLRAQPDLATVRIADERGVSRTLLHVAADWPGHFPDGPAMIAALIGAGADVDAPVHHPDQTHAETALHWAASSDDVDVLDALLDGGADIEAPGAVFTGGTPMSDAVVFAQWRAARRLLERGATTTIWQAAALGLLERVRQCCTSRPPPTAHDLTNAFWHACRGGQREVAEYLFAHGADPNWTGYDQKTALDVASESGSHDLVQWLQANDARRADETRRW